MNSTKFYLLLFFINFALIRFSISQDLNLKSPNNEIEVIISTSNNFSFYVKLKDNIIIENVDLGLDMNSTNSQQLLLIKVFLGLSLI